MAVCPSPKPEKKQPEHPPAGDWGDRLWHFYTMEHFYTEQHENTELQPLAAARQGLTVAMLVGNEPGPGSSHCRTPFVPSSKQAQPIQAGTGGPGRGLLGNGGVPWACPVLSHACDDPCPFRYVCRISNPEK